MTNSYQTLSFHDKRMRLVVSILLIESAATGTSALGAEFAATMATAVGEVGVSEVTPHSIENVGNQQDVADII